MLFITLLTLNSPVDASIPSTGMCIFSWMYLLYTKGAGGVIIMQFISSIIFLVYMPSLIIGETRLFLKMMENEVCDLILGCSFQQIPCRNKGECILITTILDGSGTYYNSSAGICNVCKANSNFMAVNSENGYYAEGKLHYCALASQITGVSIACSTVCSGADQRKY